MIKKSLLHTFIIISALIFSINSYAQDRIIHGVVTTFDSIPLIGAEVRVKSTRQTIETDTLGRFSVPVKEGDQLKVKAGGFFNQKVNLQDKTRFAAVNLKMKPGEKNREYAIGYGSVSDRNKLNALSSLNNDDVDFSQYSDIFELIRGRIAGVQVVNGEVIIRGVSSINSSNAALVVVDGVPVNSSALGTIPPIQVKSINVIKDGSSAIYGSRGANGVLIVETKRGND